jgi:hypothetical protein
MAESRKKPAAASKPRKTASVAAPTATAKATAPRKRTTKAKVTSIRAAHDEIAALAHRYWAERGYKHGHDAEDWLRAEAALLGKAS